MPKAYASVLNWVAESNRQFACRELAERTPDAVRDIQCICSFDGPGLAPHYRMTEAYARIAPFTHTFIPKSSIVGNIHAHVAGTVAYVDARKSFVAQHYVYHWETNGTHLVRARQTFISKVVSLLLNTLIVMTDDVFKTRLFRVIFKPFRLLGRRLL